MIKIRTVGSAAGGGEADGGEAGSVGPRGGADGGEEGGGEVEGAAVSAAGVALVRLGEAGAGAEAEARARECAEGRDESDTGWGRWSEREVPARCHAQYATLSKRNSKVPPRIDPHIETLLQGGYHYINIT